MSDSSTPGTPRRARKRVAKGSAGQPHQPPETPVAEATGDVAAEASPEPAPTAPDPFDPASLRLDPNTSAGAIGVRKKILVIPVKKPDKMEFVRIHPDETYRLDTAVVDDKVNRESYLVAPPLWPELPDFITPVRLCLAVNRHGTPFLWPARIPDKDRPMAWHETMMEAQELAVDSWVRVQADMSAGSYAVFEATGNLPDPEWPELSFREILRLAFKTRMIDTMSHPFLQELFGEV